MGSGSGTTCKLPREGNNMRHLVILIYAMGRLDPLPLPGNLGDDARFTNRSLKSIHLSDVCLLLFSYELNMHLLLVV